MFSCLLRCCCCCAVCAVFAGLKRVWRHREICILSHPPLVGRILISGSLVDSVEREHFVLYRERSPRCADSYPFGGRHIRRWLGPQLIVHPVVSSRRTDLMRFFLGGSGAQHHSVANARPAIGLDWCLWQERSDSVARSFKFFFPGQEEEK